MSEMFRNYPQPDDYKPDNYPKCIPCHPIEIMAGETASHTFEIPFNVEENTVNFDVLYQLGIDLVVSKNKSHCTIVFDEKFGKTFITCTLSAADTLLFKTTALQARVQIRFIMKDLSVVYTEVYKVKLWDSLDTSEEPAPEPHIITGFGYTED